MDIKGALIIASGRESAFRLPLLYYPAIKWMLRAFERAGVSIVSVVCGDGSFEDISFSEFSLDIKFIYTSGQAGTKKAIEDAAVFFADFDGRVLVFDCPVPALSEEGVSALTGFSGSGTAFTLKEGKNLARVLSLNAGTFKKALQDDFNFEKLSARLESFSYGASEEEFYPLDGTKSLKFLETYLKHRIFDKLLDEGVYIQSEENTYISPSVKFEPGSRILTGSILYGETVIKKDAVIGPNALICSSVIGAGSTVNMSQVFESVVGESTNIGPFSYVRPGCEIGSHIKIGDFVELKKAKIDDGTKISHLTYIGDAEVGKNVNFGCGTVTVNYDGNGKYLTRVEDDAFIGCNTNLIAPVTVHRGAYTAAGTTVTADVPENALAVGRCRERIIENWAAGHRGKKEKPL